MKFLPKEIADDNDLNVRELQFISTELVKIGFYRPRILTSTSNQVFL